MDAQQMAISIDQIGHYLPDRPAKTTRGRGWGGVTLDYHTAAPHYVAATPARDHHLICYCASGRGRVVQRRAGTVHDSVIAAGSSLLTPAGYDSIFEGQAPSSVRLRVPTELVERGAEEIGGRAQATHELINVFSVCDPTIECFSKLLLAEIDRPEHPAQALIVESLSCALAAHLLRRYNPYDLPPPGRMPGLDPRVLARVIDFIEGNISRSIGLAELAEHSGVSRFHFARLFRLSTGLSPIAYVERCRLRHAHDLLRKGQLPIAEIALAVGFSDQSEFTRRFHRHMGTTPAAFVRDNGLPRLPRRPR